MKIVIKGALIRLGVLAALLVSGSYWFLIRMPGRSFEGASGAVSFPR